MIKIGLIEDDDLLRNVYSSYFKATQSFQVAFSVSDITYALEFTIQPDIILLDINLPSGSGIDGIKPLLKKFRDSKIIILSSMLDSGLTYLAMKNGASGYLLKSSSIAYISESLLQIAGGGMPFSPAVATHLIKAETAVSKELTNMLTKRELELVELLSEGFSNKVAADKINVTYFTVNQHLKNIYKKLNINSKPELISWFLTLKNQPYAS